MINSYLAMGLMEHNKNEKGDSGPGPNTYFY